MLKYTKIFKLSAIVSLYFFAAPAVWATESCIDQYRQWERVDAPVLREKLKNEDYEVAGDPHVFLDQTGQLKMIYSGDDEGHISIKLASGKDWETWGSTSVLLGESAGNSHPRSKETAFYRLSESGQHQIYFIGYEKEETYNSKIYLALAESLKGPYKVIEKPIIPTGILDGKKVHTITSPSIINHDDILYMSFLAWDGFPDPENVWVLGATSSDDGLTWDDIKEISTPVGMEGQITKAPDGKYIAVRAGEYKDSEAIFLSCANHPFGPYEQSEEPILLRGGKPWEKDENQAPQITFDPISGKAHLYYSGADYSKGWWIMMAKQK